jgi:cell division protein ZapA (FtsZ GTPase activity inhibitor)
LGYEPLSLTMSGLMNQIVRLGLSLSLMDRELFVTKVSEMLEVYKDDPEQMEKIAKGLYQYLDDMKGRMDTKALLTDVVDSAKMPTKDDLSELTKAINKLADEMHQQNKKNH